ncbi:MAG: hypothetical protein WC979_01405 [Candidatus Pacearchaeota archaeon]|jgi:hypothetical protein|nr:hypothetical protein [Clostridia bacterium]
MGVETLSDYLQQNGKEKLIELLTESKVSITEKINAHRVSILKDRLNNVEFYAKKKSEPIKTYDRILSDLYEDFITHLIANKENIPQGTFNFYFVGHDLDVIYTKKPESMLLLTDMSFPKSKTKVNDSLEVVAKQLNVACQPVVFEGKLMKRKHIKDIVNYIENGGILPEIMHNLFGDNATSMSLNKSDLIEGYIFKINDKLYKLEDNRFERKVFPKVNTSGYEMLIMELSDFVSQLDFTDIHVDAKNKDMKFANFICEAFNRFIEESGDSIETMLINPPAFISSTGSLGIRYISNQKTKKYLKDERYEYLLRIFLTIFNKPLFERGLLNAEFIEKHNKLVKQIQDYILTKDNIFDFNQFTKFRNK